MTAEDRKQEVWDKITNLYSTNIQIIPAKETEPKAGAGTTEGFISRQFKTILGTKTDKQGRTIYVGTKAA